MSDRSSVFFIVGAMRSGTTLLRLMMDHHPEVCVFGEFEYAVRWIEQETHQFPERADFIRRLDEDRVFRSDRLVVDPGLSSIDLVRSFFRQLVDRSGKPIGGATVHSNFHELAGIWPDAKFVHIVRDPRDVARSSIGMGWVGNVWYGTQYWVEPIRRWREFSRQLSPTQWMQLKFEDLVRDPQRELIRICHFLGVEYSEAMLSYPNDTTYGAPDASLTEQWRRKLNADEITWIESVCGDWMLQFGYQPVTSDAEGPSRWQSLWLTVQHRTWRMRRNIGLYGLPLYASWQVAKRLPYNSWRRKTLRRVDEVDRSYLK